MDGIKIDKDEQGEIRELHNVQRGHEHKLAREQKEDNYVVFCFNWARSSCIRNQNIFSWQTYELGRLVTFLRLGGFVENQ